MRPRWPCATIPNNLRDCSRLDFAASCDVTARLHSLNKHPDPWVHGSWLNIVSFYKHRQILQTSLILDWFQINYKKKCRVWVDCGKCVNATWVFYSFSLENEYFKTYKIFWTFLPWDGILRFHGITVIDDPL